ncbi:MAG: hypothetical protein GAK45_00826 [Pseudomonas citronellolis]|nr:MAG: hypothetical protein GAK45_00826 [Pseudomonas citronellolis]
MSTQSFVGASLLANLSRVMAHSRASSLLLLVLSFPAWAQLDPGTWETDDFKEQVRDRLTDLILESIHKANACAEKGLASKVSLPTIRRINALKLREDEAQPALAYLLMKAQAACMGEQPLETIAYLHLADQLGMRDYTQQAKQYQRAMSSLLFDREQGIRFEYLFRRLPKATQEALESMDELRVPFNYSVAMKIQTIDEP